MDWSNNFLIVSPKEKLTETLNPSI